MSTKILAICGSLRKASYNRMALEVAAKLAKEHSSTLDIAELHDVPLYSGDVEAKGIPDAVQALAEKVRDADALLIGAPEYNHSISGVLKNSIDWLSRLDPMPLKGKPCAILGCSMGPQGTSRMQPHLRQVLVCLDVPVLNKPEVMIGKAQDKFADDGSLQDDKANEMIDRLLAALVDWQQTLSG